MRRFLGRLSPEERAALQGTAEEDAAITDEDRERNRAFACRFLSALTRAMLAARAKRPNAG